MFILLAWSAIPSGNHPDLAIKPLSPDRCSQPRVHKQIWARQRVSRALHRRGAGFCPVLAGILRMSPCKFYVANVLSALVWAPIHVFPGVLLAVTIGFIGASREQLTLVIIGGVILLSLSSGFLSGLRWRERRADSRYVTTR